MRSKQLNLNCCFSDFKSRQQYYLQLKRNVLQSNVATQDEVVFSLAATALHLDVGVFDESVHIKNYFEPKDYVPEWVRTVTGMIRGRH